MLNAKSIEKQTNNIIQYSASIDEKEECMKQLFIYDVFSKTQGMVFGMKVWVRSWEFWRTILKI